MATFADLGNMRAKLDTKTGMIRITSGDTGSPLKKEGFVLNVSRGTKEYTSLLELIASQGASAAEETEQEEYQLPKTVHMSEKYYSPVPERIPLGVLTDRSTIAWDFTRDTPHMLISGTAGSGKTMLVSAMLYHINRHRATSRAYVSTSNSGTRFDLYKDSFTLPYENIEVNHDPAEYINKVYSMMYHRFEYMTNYRVSSIEDEVARGDIKRLFLFIDRDSLPFPFLEKDNPSHFESYDNLEEILRSGRAAGIHVIMTSHGEMWRLGKEKSLVMNNVNRVDMSHTGEGTLFSGDAEKRFKGFFLKQVLRN